MTVSPSLCRCRGAAVGPRAAEGHRNSARQRQTNRAALPPIPAAPVDCLLDPGRSSKPRARFVSGEQLLAEHEVARQTLQNVLPRPGRSGRTNLQRPARLHGTNQIRNQPVLGPIAAANHVPRPRSRQQRTRWRVEERAAIAGGHQFAAAFRGAVRIMSTQRIDSLDIPKPIPCSHSICRW